MPLISAMMAAGVVAGLAIAADADGLRDAPIVGSAPAQYLDGTDWQASGGGLKLQARVPGDLISDLHRAKVRWGIFVALKEGSRRCNMH